MPRIPIPAPISKKPAEILPITADKVLGVIGDDTLSFDAILDEFKQLSNEDYWDERKAKVWIRDALKALQKADKIIYDFKRNGYKKI